MSNANFNGGRSGRTQTKATSAPGAKPGGSFGKTAKVDKLTKGDTYDKPGKKGY